jgi:hypothetical protein
MRIRWPGGGVMEADKYWERFCEQFDAAVFSCAEKGTSARLEIGWEGDPHNVVVDIYPQGGTMKKFNEAILAVAKDKAGVKLVKND